MGMILAFIMVISGVATLDDNKHRIYSGTIVFSIALICSVFLRWQGVI